MDQNEIIRLPLSAQIRQDGEVLYMTRPYLPPQDILSAHQEMIIGAPAPVGGCLPFDIGAAILDHMIEITLIIMAPAEDASLMDRM